MEPSAKFSYENKGKNHNNSFGNHMECDAYNEYQKERQTRKKKALYDIDIENFIFE